MRLIFLGVPGAGKSTQAAAISSQWQIPHISIDDIFHQAIAKETYLGLKVKPYVEKGDLIPDDLILDIIRKRLSHSSAQRGWVLDGFPSNLSQVKLLDQLLLEILPQGRSVLPEKLYNQVFSFYVPIDVLVQRLLERGRSDDNYQVIYRRIEVYQEHSAPLIQHYRQQGFLTVINGDRSVEVITQFLQDAVSKPRLIIDKKTLNIRKKSIKEGKQILSA
ncbi:nucleoside monophosphate kinase [Anabaena sp. FACHB-1250]|uniref:Adenylate kinase n=1 Tax=Dolichospermum planctonicum TaxID=136072 RepID=A0A480ALG4_9CYAN|nr:MULTISPECIES: nucleoside monophosphate kinase [Nostocales]MBD2142319.1 nucleoside monophosphate kinase [Anabaena sp. FACHB-1250]MBD2269821.1 nucleoside monophosphate kinase [Anabaena sp. FACHB-1391]GCL44228.1 adenylate kinase [Dolichospermum planctonicum]